MSRRFGAAGIRRPYLHSTHALPASAALAWPEQMLALYSGTAWFDPTQLTAGQVPSWTDRLSANTVTNVTSGQQPVCNATAINGKPGLRFTRASSQKLFGICAIAGLVDAAKPHTVLYMAKPVGNVTGGNFHMVASIGTSTSSTNLFCYGTQPSGTYTRDFALRTATQQVATTSRWGGEERGVSCFTYNGTVCRNLRDMAQGFSGASPSAGTCNMLVFGAMLQSGGYSHHCDLIIGDIVIVPALLTDAEIRDGMTWMRNRYVTAAATEVWLGLGDSYTEGYATDYLTEAPAPYPPPGLFMSRHAVNHVQAHYDPSGNGAPTGRGSFLGLFAQMRQAANPGAEIIIVNGGYGARQAHQQIPGTVANDRWLASLAAAMAYPGAVFAGVLHSDGFNDCATSGYVPGVWTSSWNAINAQVRALQPGSWNWHYTQLPSAYPGYGGSLPHLTTIRSEQAAWAAADRLMFEIPNDIPRPEDTVHYNTAGNLIVAQGLYDLLP